MHQIDFLLNSCPLCPLRSDPVDLSVLTPGHFLVQELLIYLPDHDLYEVPLNRLSCWKFIQCAQYGLWKKWHSDYLHTLQQGQKLNSYSVNPSIGTIKDNQSLQMH